FVGVPICPIFLLPVFVVRVLRNLFTPFDDFTRSGLRKINPLFKTKSESTYKENGREFFYKPPR
ncbi:hypothetical protein AKJ37_07215, partial [candidate division MSBL1 archaeon SCGC-AAA259I09]